MTEIRDLVPKYIKFIRVLLTIPTLTCSNEGSISYLRQLKIFDWQSNKNVNHIATLYIYREMVDKLNVGEDH